MTSGGSEDKIATAKKILINGTIGLAIILSSWAITRFILAQLGDATGIKGLDGLLGGRQGAQFDDFGGSGSLGRAIRDHYPTRDQKDVKRNVRIALTFNEPIDPKTIIENTNKTCWGADGKPTKECADGAEEYFGDCFTAPGQPFNWENDCDKLKTDAIGIFPTSTTGVYDNSLRRKGNAPDPLAAYALTSYEDGAERNAYSIVLKPVNFLGDNLKKVDYTVGISPDIKKKDGKTNVLKRVYTWNFQTDTTFDFDAPTIRSREPGTNDLIPRNQVIQVIFSEPMDPISLQGMVGAGSPFNNIIFGNQNIQGEWRLSNGYQTAEFTSTQPCGENSCGEVMYCLPEVQCAAGEDPAACTAQTEILLRSAQTLANNSFESQPLTGIADIAGNALDGDADRTVDGKPNMPGDFKTIGEGERNADNASWPFRISNTIDRTPPFVEKVLPFIDQEAVKGQDPLQFFFSKPMLHASLRGLNIEEHPQPQGVDDIWYRPKAERVEGKDVVILEHREFGPNGQDFFYFPSVGSGVKDLRQNCLYPGIGPGTDVKGQNVTCSLKENGDAGEGCVDVQPLNQSDTGCAQTTDDQKTAQPNVLTCINELKAMSNRVAQ